MARHDIDVKVPHEIWVGNKDLEVVVYADGKLFGRLHVSRGTIDWIPAKQRTSYRLRWADFDRAMQGTPGRSPTRQRNSPRRT